MSGDLPPLLHHHHHHLIPVLPNDVSIQILARVPRSSHRSLALVSRSWHAALLSPPIYQIRRSHRLSEPLLLLCIRTPSVASLWYLLDLLRNPSPQIIPISPPPATVTGAAVAALGPSLYLLGGSLIGTGVPSRAVQILDAFSRRWRSGPSMRAAREFAAAGSISGRVYAAGGCLLPPDSWIESLDPAAGIWTPVPAPASVVRGKWMRGGGAVLGGRLLATVGHGGFVYDPLAPEPTSAWLAAPEMLRLGWKGRAAVVDGILFCYNPMGKIMGYDPEKDEWMAVEGLERELPRLSHGATLATLGQLLCAVWTERGSALRSKEVEILWAGICISRSGVSHSGGLRGSIVWKGSEFLALPPLSSITHCVTVEL